MAPNRASRLALLARWLEFVSRHPSRQRWRPSRFRSEYKSESCNDRVSVKIHRRTVLVARLVIAVLREILGLLLAPFRRVACKFDSFIDRKRRHAHARQTEMIRAVVVPRFRARVRPDRQSKIFRRRLHGRIKHRSFGAAYFHFFRCSER